MAAILYDNVHRTGQLKECVNNAMPLLTPAEPLKLKQGGYEIL